MVFFAVSTRKLGTFSSIITLWCTRRSIAAAVVNVSLKIWSHLLKTKNQPPLVLRLIQNERGTMSLVTSQLVLAKSGVTVAVASNTHLTDPLSIMPAHLKSIFVRCRDQIQSMGRWTAPGLVVLKLITARTSPPKTNLQSRWDLRFRKFSTNGAEIHSCGNPIWQSAPIFKVCRNSGLSHW